MGYQTGLHSIAHVVYWVTQDVDASFDVISGLIVSRSMVGLFSDDLPELKLRVFVL